VTHYFRDLHSVGVLILTPRAFSTYNVWRTTSVTLGFTKTGSQTRTPRQDTWFDQKSKLK